MRTPVALLFLLGHVGCSQVVALLPQNAHTNLYFPHIADGGPAAAQWQTRFSFTNPNTSAAIVTLNLYSNTGGGLVMDLGMGQGPTSKITFSVPANGTVVPRSQISPVATEGWAYATATLPIQANVAFRFIQNGVAKVEVTAEPTLPSGGYRSLATPQMGVAVANVYTTTKSYVVTAYGATGSVLGQGSFTLPGSGHLSFNLNRFLPNLPSDFDGSLLVKPQVAGEYLVGWALYADSSGMISSLPDGRTDFPLPHPDLITEGFDRLVNAYQTMLPDFGPAPQLVRSNDTSTQAINAHASGGTTVQINYALSELVNDSPSELAFVIGHGLGHIYQQRTGNIRWYADPEWDADCWALMSQLYAGYDPYGGAGALGKLMMATATSGLLPQLTQDWEQEAGIDAHGSFPTRIDNLTTFIQYICSSSQGWQTYCQTYKTEAHPHFPDLPYIPLAAPQSPANRKAGLYK